MLNKRINGLAVISVLYVILFIIAPPYGEFPLMDDWNYSWTVRHLLETGEVRIPEFPSASVIAHAFLGFLFAKSFGFSFAILKISVFIAGFLGTAAAYLLLRELGLEESKSLFGALLLMFNPVYFLLSYTFMTDVTFIAALTAATLFYVKAVKSGKTWHYAAGSLFSVVAFLIRQPGIFLPATVFGWLLLSNRKEALHVKCLATVVAIPVLSAAIYFYWYFFVHGPTGFSSVLTESIASPIQYPFRVFTFFLYMGLFLLPLTLSCLPSIRKAFTPDKRIIAAVALFLAASVFSIIVLNAFFSMSMPYLPSIINKNGLGTSYLQGEKSPELSQAAGIVVAAVTALSGALVFYLIVKYLLQLNIFSLGRELEKPETLLYASAIPQFLFLFVVIAYFDHYLLPILVPLTVFVLKKSEGVSRPLFMIGLAAMALLSIVGTQDYQAWSSAKNEAINYLLDQNVSNSSIEAGYEYDCGNFCYYSLAHPELNISKPYDPDWVTGSAYVINSTYLVSFSPVERYGVVREFPYFSYLTLKEERIYVSKLALP